MNSVESPEFNSDLVDDLARQRAALFIGSGASSSVVTVSGRRLKGWEEFLRDVASNAQEPTRSVVDQILGARDFLLASELLQRHFRERWPEFIMSEFGQAAEPGPLHRSIWGLGQRILLTTNFDKLLESAFPAVTRDMSHYPTVLSEINGDSFKILKEHTRNYIVKIHGSVDLPDKLIFSRSEYVRLAFGNTSYASFLESILLNYTILFIGFSMDDPAICSLMEMYALRYPNSRPHYIVSPAGRPDDIKEVFGRLRKLKILEYDSCERHKRLPELLDRLRSSVALRRREIVAAWKVQEAEQKVHQ